MQKGSRRWLIGLIWDSTHGVFLRLCSRKSLRRNWGGYEVEMKVKKRECVSSQLLCVDHTWDICEKLSWINRLPQLPQAAICKWSVCVRSTASYRLLCVLHCRLLYLADCMCVCFFFYSSFTYQRQLWGKASPFLQSFFFFFFLQNTFWLCFVSPLSPPWP